MLYVFHVDTGTMMTFDMNLALETVSYLQSVIDNLMRIPVEKQVLLVSGGESLDPNARVCSYSAGTDTNPIYLFSKSVIESTNPPTPSLDLGADLDLKEQVEASLSMPATYSTVVARAQLAQQFCELAREQTRLCERLVHDQHLQQQGWAAVVANLEDITAEFQARSERFQFSFKQYLEMRTSYLECLQNFSSDLTTLSKIPILPVLRPEPEDSTSEIASVSQSESTHDEKKPLTLLQWISAADDQSSLEQVAEQCSRGLDQLDSKVIETLCSDVKTALDAASNAQMKEVKGLGDRLYGLEQLMCESKRYVQEQSDLAQAFLQNQNRASNLGDASILPDLCASHRRQLLVMLENHQRLRDIRRRCMRAKEELSVNLYHRLKWIMYVENLILETDHKLMIYHESLKRLRRHIEIIQQIHLAPAMYLNAIAEVVRRRAFSQAFLLWASELACHILTIYNDEVTRRKDFQSQFSGHFLNTLFPGMDDLPPSFATQAPSIFDSRLPKLSTNDIEMLRAELPELTEAISVPDVSVIAQCFFVKSTEKDEKVDERGVDEKMVAVVNEMELDGTLLKPMESETFLAAHPALPHLKDLDKGCESETDTEEFEKVGQSPLELQFDAKNPVSPRPGTTDASTLTEGHPSVSPPLPAEFATDEFYIDESMPSSLSVEGTTQSQAELGRQLEHANNVIALFQDNLSSSRTELDKLRSVMLQMAVLVNEALKHLRLEIAELKEHFEAELNLTRAHCADLNTQWKCYLEQNSICERETLQRLTVDHELEQSDLKRLLQSKIEEIQSLREETQCLERSLEDRREENRLQKDGYERLLQLSSNNCEELTKRIGDLEGEKERAVIEAKEALVKEHKAEIESIRSRFKLLKNRSPSDSSLEKIDHNLIDVSKHAEIVQQLRDDYNVEKEKAVNEAVLQERLKMEAILKQELRQNKIRFEQEKQMLFNEALCRVVDEKDKQIECLREREATLHLECIKYRNTIQQLTDCESENSNSALMEKVVALEREKCRLEAELSEERLKRVADAPQDLVASVAVYEEKCDAATSPTRIRDKLTSSQTSLIQAGKINIASCNIGDPVLVVWDAVYQNYVILQESHVLYFLHSDCTEAMGLKQTSHELQRKLYVTAEVVDKEYCHAKKVENRYRVPKGTKFYRVKVKPLPHWKELLRSLHHSSHSAASGMSQSQTIEQTSSVILSSVTESQSVPISPVKDNVQQEESTVHPEP